MSQIPQRDTGMCPMRKETESICRFVWMLVYFCACYIIFSILKKGTIDKAEDHSSPETKQRIKAINQSAMYKVDFCSLHIKCRTQVHKNSNKIYGQHADPKLNTTFRPWDFFSIIYFIFICKVLWSRIKGYILLWTRNPGCGAGSIFCRGWIFSQCMEPVPTQHREKLGSYRFIASLTYVTPKLAGWSSTFFLRTSG